MAEPSKRSSSVDTTEKYASPNHRFNKMFRTDLNEPNRTKVEEETKSDGLDDPPVLSLLKKFDTADSWHEFKPDDLAPMIVIDNPTFIPSPLSLMHREKNRWDITKSISKAELFFSPRSLPP
jgi:hypothetical protein